MLRITQNTSADGTHKYFFGYYAEQELDMSKWAGKGAEKLGLKVDSQRLQVHGSCIAKKEGKVCDKQLVC